LGSSLENYDFLNCDGVVNFHLLSLKVHPLGVSNKPGDETSHPVKKYARQHDSLREALHEETVST
jgi:hypothetical protein